MVAVARWGCRSFGNCSAGDEGCRSRADFTGLICYYDGQLGFYSSVFSMHYRAR